MGNKWAPSSPVVTLPNQSDGQEGEGGGEGGKRRGRGGRGGEGRGGEGGEGGVKDRRRQSNLHLTVLRIQLNSTSCGTWCEKHRESFQSSPNQ